MEPTGYNFAKSANYESWMLVKLAILCYNTKIEATTAATVVTSDQHTEDQVPRVAMH